MEARHRGLVGLLRDEVTLLGASVGGALLVMLLEFAFAVCVRIPRVAFWSPGRAWDMLLAGVGYYTLGGLLLGVGVAGCWLPIWLMSRLRGRFGHPGWFALCMTPALALFVGANNYLNREILLHYRITHPVSLASNAGLFLLCYALGVVAYLWLSRNADDPDRAAAARAWRRRVLLGSAAAVVLMLAVGAVRGWIGGAPEPSPRPWREVAATTPVRDDLPNVLLITIETLRAEQMSLHGYAATPPTSPGLDAYAQKGAWFRLAEAQSSWTPPSVASILSSLYPGQHGRVMLRAEFNPSIVTLPTLLADAGYRTAMVHTNINAYSPNFGYDWGGASWEPEQADGSVPYDGRLFLLTRPLRNVGMKLHVLVPWLFLNTLVDADRLVVQMEQIMEDFSPGPYFLHAHLFDPHAPYYDHPYGNLHVNVRREWNVDTLVSRYDAEIRFMDEKLAAFLSDMESRGLLDDTIVVITSDHGEEFLEHGEWEHGNNLYQEVLHVPLILVYPEAIPAGVEVTPRVRLIDIAPTVLELAGLDVPDSFEGRSLMPLIRGEETEDRDSFTQVEFPARFDALSHGRHKLVRNSETGEIEVYDLVADARELDDLSTQDPALAAELQRRLDEYLRHVEATRVSATERELSPEDIERLRAIGYME